MLSLSITGFWIIFWFIPKLTECRIQDKFVTIARCRSVCLDLFSSNKDCDDKEFLKHIKERLLILFDGLQSPNTQNLDVKLDVTLNFLEYLLARIDEKLNEK